MGATAENDSPTVTNIKILKGADPDDKFTITFHVEIENMSTASLGEDFHVKFNIKGIDGDVTINGKRTDSTGTTNGFLQFTPSIKYALPDSSYAISNIRLYKCELSKLKSATPIQTIQSFTSLVYTNLNSFS